MTTIDFSFLFLFSPFFFALLKWVSAYKLELGERWLLSAGELFFFDFDF